ncbi:MAG: EAL domain-containing protein [Pyrinomonadaceae bacterium]
MERPQILIIDDDEGVRNLLCELLTAEYDCGQSANGADAMEQVRRRSFDLALIDINLGTADGIQLAGEIARVSPDTVIVMVTGSMDINSAINSMRLGAFDYITKPFHLDVIADTVRRAIDRGNEIRASRKEKQRLSDDLERISSRLRFIESFDPITQLPNATRFETEIEHALKRGDALSVVRVSMPRFDNVRNTLGQACAQSILIDAAARLRHVLGEDIVVSRIEAADFGFFVRGGADDVVLNVISDLRDALNEPFVLEGHEFFAAPRFGIARAFGIEREARLAIADAGAALAYAIRSPDSDHAFYSPEMHLDDLDRLVLEADLYRAIERDELRLAYQPTVNVFAGDIVGVEALLRWRRGGIDDIAPLDFIGIAEDNGLILELGQWVLREACRQMREWHDQGLLLRVAVNISPRQFYGQDLVAMVDQAFEETGADPSYLDIEITESILMSDRKRAAAIVERLRALGISVAIDDFGTGASSLEQLKNLPADILKIDRSFISDIVESKECSAVVTAILDLAHRLNLEVIAEGVETQQQLERLRALKCDKWQGFLMSPPAPPDEIPALATFAAAAAAEARVPHRTPHPSFIVPIKR